MQPLDTILSGHDGDGGGDGRRDRLPQHLAQLMRDRGWVEMREVNEAFS